MNALIITGERSAENYASLLVDELNRKGNFNFFSICSNILENKTEKIADYRDISIIGAKEAIGIIKKALRTLSKTKKTIKEQKIELVILLDFPEFNLKIAKFSKKIGAKVVYYITPQIWAWRQYRIKQLIKYTDLVIPILPFERMFFNAKGLKNIKYFGHPLIDLLHNRIGTHKKEKIILLMPGSRKSEIEFNYKPIFEAAKLIKEKYEDFEFVWVYPKHLNSSLRDRIKGEFEFVRVENDSYEFMDKAYFGILKSGTTTLEAALFGLPMVVVYKLSKLSYNIGRMIIKNINYISLPNLIMDKKIVEELIEDRATPSNIFEAFDKIHTDKSERKRVIEQLKNIQTVLGEYPITPKIAEEIVKIL
ncbi:lipid-A-disaccharide synthase [Hippea alviniae]|uniref:lipid-A-disaccharide synthase n=1 Tax=Hippea alviniae TaxID=1279027 RepID=UPI0003B78269|nr:lipid-A-disaccharide synthase [Hippea alviniae]